MTTEPLKQTMAGTSLTNRPHGHYYPKTPRSCNKVETTNQRKKRLFGNMNTNLTIVSESLN